MFSGIVAAIGRIQQVSPLEDGVRLTVDVGSLDLSDVQLGDSIANNGVCLTVIAHAGNTVQFDVSRETLNCTVGLAEPGEVNLEKALRLSDRLGGHLVSGHVDGTGTLSWRRPEGNAVIIFIQASPELLRYIIPKGSVAVDGVSLTVASVDRKGFSVSLIPHTAAVTTLGQKEPGAMVNIETDLIGKYVEKLLQPYRAGKAPAGEKITLAMLRENGF